MSISKVRLPEGYDPYDMRLKRQFHANADAKNVIAVPRKNPVLCCGAITGDKICHNTAGAGTDHLGYGRCRIHGGCSTGPKTEEGAVKSAQNKIKHGLYASALLPGEAEVFNQLSTESELKSLEFEINVQKTKIISYLMRNKKKFEERLEQTGDEDAAYKSLKVFFSDGDGVRRYYHAATIEDNALDRALRTLRSLVETHNRISGNEESTDILDVINKELQAASQGSIALSWSTPSEFTEKRSTNCSTDAE